MSSEALKLSVFHCSNHLDSDRLEEFARGHGRDVINAISLPCAGKIDIPYLIKAFETGADAVVLVTCGKDECRHVEGSTRAHKRAEAVRSLLAEIGGDPKRMAVIECQEGGAEHVCGEIRQFIDRARQLSPMGAGRGISKESEATVP